MLFYDSSVPTTATPAFDAAFFARAAETDVIVRDAQGQPIRNADGSFRTRKGELRDLLVPMAGDRAAALAQTVNNHRVFVEEGNEWVGKLHRLAQELERIRPAGVNSSKTPKTNVNGQELNAAISAEAANTLLNLKDSAGAGFLGKFFVSPNLVALAVANAARQAAGQPPLGFDGPITLTRMADNQAFATFDNAFKSAIDQVSQKVQLDQSTLQGLVSRQNNAIETMADLQNKFTATLGKLVGNLRPPQ